MPFKDPSDRVIELKPLPGGSEHSDGRTSARPRAQTIDPPARGAHWIAIGGAVMALMWTAGALAFLFGYMEWKSVESQRLVEHVGLAFIAIGPAPLLIMLGVLGREALRFSTTARTLERASLRLAAPLEHARLDAVSLADAITGEIDRLNRASEGALARLGAIEEVLRHHSESVDAASGAARRQVDALIEDLQRERAAIVDLSVSLNGEAKKISQTIDRQAEMVAQAADLAASHANEGRELLEKSAERLVAASGQAQKSGEKAAFAIGEQMRDMEALVRALDERANRLDAVARAHEGNLKVAQNTSHELTLAAEAGSSAMKAAVEQAIEQAKRLASVIQHETSGFATRGIEEIERLRKAAQLARESAESAGRALEHNASSILRRVDEANRAGFEAGRPPAAAAAAPPSRPLTPAEIKRAERDRRLAGSRDLDFDEPRVEPRAGLGRDLAFAREAPLAREAAPPPTREPTPAPREVMDAFRELDRAAGSAGAGAAGLAGRSDLRELDPFGDAFDDDEIDRLGRLAEERKGQGRPNGRGEAAHGDDFVVRRVGDAPSPLRGGGGADGANDGGWRWKDVLKGMDDDGGGAGAAGEAVLAALRRAGVDPMVALDQDLTTRIARARRRAGSGEARALVLDGALNEVRRTAAALAADPALRGRAEEFMDDHGRMVRRAIDENDLALLANLLDTELGRAYLLVDAALSDG